MQEYALYYHSNNLISKLKLAQYCKMNFWYVLGSKNSFLFHLLFLQDALNLKLWVNIFIYQQCTDILQK